MIPLADAKPLLLPYALAVLIILGEIPTYFRRRVDSQKRDGGSYWLVMVLTTSGYWLAFFWAILGKSGPAFPAWIRWTGAVLTVCGIAFRLWAVKTLGAYFTRVVRVSSDQSVVRTGPYRWLRHPSYTGGLLAAAGVGVALGSWTSLALVVVPMLTGLLYRIKVEEEALAGALGSAYVEFCRSRKRLLPFLF